MTDISIADKVCLIEYFINRTDEAEIMRLLTELRQEYKPVEVKPPIGFIFDTVCKVYEVKPNEVRKSKKRFHAYIKLVFTRVAARIYGVKKYGDRNFRKKVADCLHCSIANVTKYLNDYTKMYIVNRSCEDDITYISTVTYYNYLKVKENEQK